MVSIFSLGTPLTISYGFHARRQAPQKLLAWIGLLLSLVLLLPFAMLITGSVLNVLAALSH